MTEFFIQACILAWAIIGTVIGWVILLIIIGFGSHESYVLLSQLFNNPNNEKDNS